MVWGSTIVSRLSLILGLCGCLFVFLMTRLVFKDSWEEGHRNEVSSSSHRFRAAWCQHNHHHGCWLCSPGWGDVCKVLLCPPFHTVLPGRSQGYSGWGVKLHFLEGSIFTPIIDNFPIQKLFLSLFYLLIQSFICINTDSQIFILSFELLSNMLFLFCSSCSYLWLRVDSVVVDSVVLWCGPIPLFWKHFLLSFPVSKMLQAPPPG